MKTVSNINNFLNRGNLVLLVDFVLNEKNVFQRNLIYVGCSYDSGYYTCSWYLLTMILIQTQQLPFASNTLSRILIKIFVTIILWNNVPVLSLLYMIVPYFKQYTATWNRYSASLRMQIHYSNYTCYASAMETFLPTFAKYRILFLIKS